MATGQQGFQKIAEWRDNFMKEHVQGHAAYKNGNEFVSAESTVVVSGPPRLVDSVGAMHLVPIGLVQGAQVGQQKQIQQMYEVGSRLPFYIPGRTFVSASLSRILFDGPSLMYALYIAETEQDGRIYLNSHSNPTTEGNPWKSGFAYTPIDTPSLPATDLADKVTNSLPIDITKENEAVVNGSPAKVNADPGYFFCNLASSFFNRPLGLGFIIYDMEKQPYGGFYLEECYINSHSFNIAAAQTVLVENVAIRATALKPLSTKEM